MIKDLFEVYCCWYFGDIVYIGSGKAGRSYHCTSGISHVYDLNRLHFKDGENVSVEVVKFFENKKDSLEYEKQLILLHKPEFNTVFKSGNRGSCATAAVRLRNRFRASKHLEGMSDQNLEKYGKLLDEFFNFHTYKELLNGTFNIYSRTFYKKLNMNHMVQLTRLLRDGDKYYGEKHFCVVFYKTSKEVLGYDIKQLLCEYQAIN